MITAILPVKSSSRALERLAAVLDAAERRELARILYREMLDRLLETQGLAEIVVVSSDREVLSHAEQKGVRVLREETQVSHSVSADWAAGVLQTEGVDTVASLPIDIPLATRDEIRSLLDLTCSLPRPSLVIVPSADGTGTNALVRTPPAAIPSQFGPNSLAAHMSAASRKGIPYEVVRYPGLMADLDSPEDLLSLCASHAPSRSLDFLGRIGAPARAEEWLSARGRDNHSSLSGTEERD